MRKARYATAGMLLAVVSLFSSVPAGAAPGAGVLTVSLQDAAARPVPITVGLGQATLIKVGAPIVVISVSPPDIVHVVLRDQAAVLVPLRLGRASVEVGLGGTTVATFEVTVVQGSGVHAVYLQPSPLGSDAVGAPAAPADPGRATASSTSSTGPAPQPPTPSLAPTPVRPREQPIEPRDSSASAAARRGVRLVPPSGVEASAIATQVGGDLYISYVIQNRTGHALTTDPRTIRVTPGSGGVIVRQIDIDALGVVPSGAMETGVVTLHPKGAQVTVEWPLGAGGTPASLLSITVDTTALGPRGGQGAASAVAPYSAGAAGAANAGVPPATGPRLVERVTMVVPAAVTAPDAQPPTSPLPMQEPAHAAPAAGADATPALPSVAPVPELIPVTLDDQSKGWITAKAQAEGGTVTVHYTIRNNLPWTTLVSRGIIVTDAHGHAVPAADGETAPLKPIPSGRSVSGVLHLPRGALPTRVQWQWAGAFRAVWTNSVTIGQ